MNCDAIKLVTVYDSAAFKRKAKFRPSYYSHLRFRDSSNFTRETLRKITILSLIQCTNKCIQYKYRHFYSKTNQMHQCLKFILFGVRLLMFRTVFPSIIRSSRLYIQQQTFVIKILLSACQQADSVKYIESGNEREVNEIGLTLNCINKNLGEEKFGQLRKPSVRTISVPVEIRIQHLRNTSHKLYHLATQLSTRTKF